VSEPAYIVGIDLGTTNSVVSYTEAASSGSEIPSIKILKIPQISGPGLIEQPDILPSFIYIPEQHELSDNAIELPWDMENKLIVGEYAKSRGAEVPQRLISSSKSWLCNTMIDRNKPVLPWDCPDDISQMSPVAASSNLLQHIRNVWNHIIARDDDRLIMENQEIYLTVPASFDAVARDLTVKASIMAGLQNVILIEEPQAAFYSWIESQGDKWRKQVAKNDTVLVCDIGGGTTDLSLIRISENNGDLNLERIAVGEHLLVGGDNMDLALAYFLSNKLSESGTTLTAWQMRSLVHSCRNTKEYILSNDDVNECQITILGEGSSLIGGTIKTVLTIDDIINVVLNGFFPDCEISSQPKRPQRMGLQETGLRYESDPAITRHLATFISRHSVRGDVQEAFPSAVLFNGGSMKSSVIRQRIMEIIDSWKGPQFNSDVEEINTDKFDFAVARGAVYFGLARRGNGIRIRGGIGKTYYIGIAASMPAVPGISATVKALCVAPFGMEEGTTTTITDQEFVLVVGEPVRFDFLGSSIRKEDTVGTIVEDWQGYIEEITTIEATLDGIKDGTANVTLKVKVTEIGTLELWCVSKESQKQWKLEFNVREQE